ncbi:ExeM/NucH family extracellular endonuclease [Rubrivivax albus]|uniref:ExeM/NucH family extracellular endonuclease n=1 Tax=Rubrivivax albus TaxID=2499835 RepID=A0A437JZA8_9BURK|nr:ExeM/NucH family extracellular endonuclease [Rubrivivax albus]RVT53371.1 ExeM/NucH family extracellular endonuclease [Rubrivivax albus]
MRLLHSIAAAALAACCLPAWAQASVTIPALQGSGLVSPLAGQRVTTEGVVTHVVNNGFFLQDPVGDGDPATSDGVFVFTSSAPTVNVGDVVRLTGTVTEFDVSGSTANPAAEARPLTELTSISGLTVLGSGSVAPTVVTLPVPEADGLERYEGMLVTLRGPQGDPLTVQQNFFQGRYGQLTVAAGGRRETPTNAHRPGTPEALALASLNARSTLLLDDNSSRQNPVPTPYLDPTSGVARAGDTVASLTGTIDFGLATNSSAGIVAYRLQPTMVPAFTASNPRPASPPAVGGNLKLAAFNVLNYFTTFTNGSDAFGNSGQTCTQGGSTPSASLCRGASNATEFERQRTKIVAALAAIDADVIGLMEIQNNGDIAAQHLADALNAVTGAGTWAVAGGAVSGGGTGTDAIRTAMLYKPGRLARVGAAVSDADPVHNRPPLAQTFEAANGERFTVIVNHFKSKGCGDATGPDLDQTDGQGCYNAQRTAQAHALAGFAASLTSGGGRVLITGDLNAYGQEDPITTLAAAGYADQLLRFGAAGAPVYSYVFDGAAGRLDHALASAPLAVLVTGATTWAINADEASLRDYNQEFKAPNLCSGAPCPADPYAPDVYRASDHDPVIVGLALYKPVAGDAGRNVLMGSTGDDLITGFAGADRLTGGTGGDLFAYTSMRDAGDVVTDFIPGEDRIDLRALLAPTGYAGEDAVADGVVRFRPALGGSTRVEVDLDGPSGGGAFRALLTLRGVSPVALDGRRDLLVK